jgi:hypothetical protein
MPGRWQALGNRLEQLASGWTLLLAVGIYAFYLASVMPAQSRESQAYAGDWAGPDRQFFYTPEEFYTQIATWGDAGRRHYVDFRLGLDIGFALSYAAFLITVTGVAGRKAWPHDRRRQLLLLIPLVPMGCDLLENALGIALVSSFPQRYPGVAWLAAVATAAKWLSLALAHVVMLAALVAAAARVIARPRAGP